MSVDAKAAEVRAMVAGIFVALALFVSLVWQDLGQETKLASADVVGEFPKLHSVRLWDRSADRLVAVMSGGMIQPGLAGAFNRQ